MMKSDLDSTTHLELSSEPEWLSQALVRGGIALWRWDIHKDNVVWLPSTHFTLGIELSQLGRTVEGFYQMIHPEDRLRCRAVVERSLDNGSDYRDIYRIPQGEGNHVWVESVGTVVRNEAGQAVAIEGAIHNITDRVLAEEEISKTHADYQRIVSAAGLAVYHHDIPGDAYRLANFEILEDIVGVKYEGSHSRFWEGVKSIDSHALGEYASLPISEAARKFRAGEIDMWRAEYKIQRPDGQIRWIFDSSYAIRDAQGVVVGSFGSLQDVTEIRRISEVISKIVSQTAIRGDAYLQQLTFALSEALEVRFAFIGEIVEGQELSARMVASAENGKPIENVTYALKGTPCEKVYEEGICYFRDYVQQLFPEDAMLVDIGAYAYLGAPLKASSGKPIGLIIVLHDGPINDSLDPTKILQLFGAHAAAEIERLKSEKALKESESFYRSLVTVQSEGILVLDDQNHIVTCNPSAQRLLELSEEDFKRFPGLRSRFQVIDVDGNPVDPSKTPSKLALATGAPQRDQTYGLQRSDGSVTWLSVNAMPIDCEDGVNTDRVVVSFTDISPRLHAEEELRRLNVDLEALVSDRTIELQRANRELESFAYSVSHDLRQPLRAIDGFSRILEMDYGDRLDGEARKHIDTIRSATRRMSQLIDDLLRLSRLISHDFVPVQVDMTQLASDVLGALVSEQADNLVEIEIQEGLVAYGDESLLRAVLDNLLQNALKFSAKCEHPSIQVGYQEGAFFVRDNGVGFDMKYSSKLFEPFQRLHGREEFEGTGIGLATVHRIIERHKGQVWAESEPGVGTTLFFSLPSEPLTISDIAVSS